MFVVTLLIADQPSQWWLVEALIRLSVLLAGLTTRVIEATIRTVRLPRTLVEAPTTRTPS